MSQSRKGQNKKGSTAQGEHPLPHPVERHSRATAIAIIGAVLIVILATVGVMAYPTYIAPFHKSIISIDNSNISMDYFLKRMKLSGSDALAMLSTLTNEELIRLGAPSVGVDATPQEVDETLHAIFQGQSGNVSADSAAAEAEFKEWYRQTLNNTGLSDAEYRDVVKSEVLRQKLQEGLAARMSTIAEHAHIYLITVETQKQAEAARARWAAGEDFGAIAKEVSLDTEIGAKGGELGWFPKGGILTPQLEFEAFDLTTGNVSAPIPIYTDTQQPDGSTAPTVVGYHLMLVTERAQRELDADALQLYRSKVVDTWLETERTKHDIKWRGINGDAFDSETYAWINYQLAKGKAASQPGASGSQQQQPGQ